MLNSHFSADNIYFSDDNEKITDINEMSFVLIKSSSIDNDLQELEMSENKINIIHPEDENCLLNDKCNCNSNSTIETTLIDVSTQTPALDDNESLKSELIALRIKYAKLDDNFNKVSNLLKHFIAIDKENPQLDEIKMQLALIVNRELRQHHAFPFISFMNKF